MATQQFGYGRTAWDVADQLVVRIPTLNQPGGAAPQFKENKYTALAAKSIGEMLYNQSQKSNAEKKKAFEKQKQDKIKAKQAKLQKDTNVIYGSAFNALEQTPDFENARKDSTKVYKDNKTQKLIPEKNEFVDVKSSDVSQYFGALNENDALRERILGAAAPFTTSTLEKWTPNMIMDQSDKKSHLNREAFTKWANDMQYKDGAGQHFYPTDGKVNYKGLQDFELNPMKYFEDVILNKGTPTVTSDKINSSSDKTFKTKDKKSFFAPSNIFAEWSIDDYIKKGMGD